MSNTFKATKSPNNKAFMESGRLVSGMEFVGDRVAVGEAAGMQQSGRIRGVDHVALSMQNTGAVVAFDRSLGLQVAENPQAVAGYIRNQMMNFHWPATWQRESFTIPAPAAKPPCGDLCFVWDLSAESLKSMLDRAGV